MQVIRGKIDRDCSISEDTDIHGMIVGTVEVLPGAELNLYGMVTGDLVIKPEATVLLHGMVNGNVINDGGTLKVFGMVNGTLIRKQGQTIIDINSSVKEIQ